MTAIVVPSLLWLAGFRFQWRKDRRETEQGLFTLMGSLIEQQRAELARLLAESATLRRQLDLIIEGRYRLQDAIDLLREQTIAARVMIHDYERRLGVPETVFAPLSAPIVIDRHHTGAHPEEALRQA